MPKSPRGWHSAAAHGIAYLHAPGRLATLGAMSKKRPRRTTPLTAANDNLLGVKPSLRYVWSVYRAAARARWVSRIVASMTDEAIEVAARSRPRSPPMPDAGGAWCRRNVVTA